MNNEDVTGPVSEYRNIILNIHCSFLSALEVNQNVMYYINSRFTYLLTSDYTANQQFVNSIIFNRLKYCDWHCLVINKQTPLLLASQKTSAGILLLIFVSK